MADSPGQPLTLHDIYLMRDIPLFQELQPSFEQPQDSDEEIDDSDEESESAAHQAGTMGLQRDWLSSLPLEVIANICSQLPVAAIFRMARVSKLYRRLLMTRASEHIWQTARRRADWQDLQSSEIDELGYAKYIARVCSICGTFDVAENRVMRCADLHRALCSDCHDKHAFVVPGSKDDLIGIHELALDCVQISARCLSQMALLPDLRFESGLLRQYEDDAIQSGWNPTAAARAYIRQRSYQLGVALADSTYLAVRGDQWDEDEFEDARNASLSHCRIELAKMHYEAEDFPLKSPLEEWWCRCACQNSNADFLYEKKQGLALSREPWINLDDPCDKALSARAYNALHAGCHQLPSELWHYWTYNFDMEEDDVYYETKPCEREWIDLGKVYCAIAERSKERRTPEQWHARLRQLQSRLVELLREEAEGSASIIPTALNYFWKRVVKNPVLVYAPPHKLRTALSLIPTDRLLECLAAKFDHAKLVIFMRIAKTLRDEEPTALTNAIDSLLESFDPSRSGLTLASLETHFAGHALKIDEMMKRVTALLKCGFCARKMPFEELAEHLVNEHCAGRVAPFALVPDEDFRNAMRDLLKSLQMPNTTKLAEIRSIKVDVVERMPSGLTLTLCGVPLEEALSGKSNCELPRARRLVDGSATDRQILALRPAATAA